MLSTYIGIDPATHTGWAILDQDGKRLQSGVWDLSASRTEGSGMVYLKFEKQFRSLLELPFYDDYRVGYERYINHFPGAAQPSAGIQGYILGTCAAMGVRHVVGFAPKEIKLAATGKGNASKAAMVQAARDRWQLYSSPFAEDEADALWIAETLRRSLEQ